MTVEEMRVAKQKAEAEILRTLSAFTSETGMSVEGVRVCFVEYRLWSEAAERRLVSGVTIAVRL